MSKPKTTTIDDVDQLVQMINLNGPRQQQSTNPKKAAKKARQKARKEEERRLKEEAERAALLAQQRKALEEQLERAARELQQLKLASKAFAKRTEAAANLAKENKAKSKDLKGANSKSNARRGNASVGVLKVIPDHAPQPPRNIVCPPTKCTHLCSIHTAVGDQASAVIQPTATETGKKKKKKKKKGSAVEEHQCEADVSPAEPEILSDYLSDLLKSEPAKAPATAGKSKKSRKRNKAGKDQSGQSKSAKPPAMVTISRSDSVVAGGTSQPATQSGTPYGVNGPAFHLEPGKMTNYLHSGNSHLDWNKFSSGEATNQSSSSAKPEMVTIRRHPTVSDTTVTISIKNQNGDEDILYTLLNGQVVRAKPNAVDIDTFIADENSVQAVPQKPSKKKKNRKKTSKKDPASVTLKADPANNVVEVTSTANPVEFLKSTDRDVVVCSPVLPSAEPVVPTCSYATPPPQQEQTFTRSYSYFDDNAEIDLSKLKLPPGITITKVNQPVSSLPGRAEKSQSVDHVNISMAATTAPSTASSSGPYHQYQQSSSFNPSVLVVDSQSYSADNESDDGGGRTGVRREAVKIKRLRSRLNRHSCGGERGECQEKRITSTTTATSDLVGSVGWQPSEDALGSIGLPCGLTQSHHHVVSPMERPSKSPSANFTRPHCAGAKRKQPSPSCTYQTDLYIDSNRSLKDTGGCHLFGDAQSPFTSVPNINFQALAQMYSSSGGSVLGSGAQNGVNGCGGSPVHTSVSPSDFQQGVCHPSQSFSFHTTADSR